jgi:hypothetical protein
MGVFQSAAHGCAGLAQWLRRPDCSLLARHAKFIILTLFEAVCLAQSEQRRFLVYPTSAINLITGWRIVQA